METLRKIVIGLSGGFTLVSFLTLWLLEVYFAYTSPRAPVPATGKPFSINVHGTVVYLTRCQYLLAGPPMFWVGFYSFLVLGLLIAILGDPFSHKQ